MSIDWDGLVLGPVMGIFGAVATWTPEGGTPVPLTDAVFDEQAEEQVLIDGQPVIRKRPLLGVRTAALNGLMPGQNDIVTIAASSKTYVVREALPDGHGHVLLYLAWTGT